MASIFDDEISIAELATLIAKYQKSYYEGEAEISDAEFDALWDELKKKDPNHPLLHKIGSDVPDTLISQFKQKKDSSSSSNTSGFQKAKHLIPMGSQEKAANPEEFILWTKKMDFSEYVVEYKLDGASLELQYENGEFVRAVTRGDGEIGDDITSNVKKMQGVVFELKEKLTGAVRGEVIMSHQVHEKYFSDKANCRNAANGLMKRKEGEGSQYLQVICYDAWFYHDDKIKDNKQPFADEVEKIEWLQSQGFVSVPVQICNSEDDVIQYRSQVMEIRSTLDYDIDGLVIKNRKLDFSDASRARPEKQIAFKFSLEEAVSILRKVVWQESGATYTPVGEFDTVELAGTKVSRASLVNPNTIRGLGIQLGSHIVVTKRGEIIPKIESVVHSAIQTPPTIPIEFPSVCTTCNTLLVDDGTRLYCPNKKCLKRVHHRLEKWISVLDIRDFGENLIRRLYENNRLSSIYDIYTLTVEELSQLDRLGDISASKIINSIHSKRVIRLSQFIAGFDIEGIGEVLVDKLVEAGYNSLDKLFTATPQQISEVYGFGDITGKTLVDGLAENRIEMEKLVADKIIEIESIGADSLLSGLSFCFTGELHSMKRNEGEQLIKSNGGSVKSSVVKGLSYLVTNDTTSGSSKNKKARELGIPIINEEEFLALLESKKK
jgi:DNA ligase (NAD+)